MEKNQTTRNQKRSLKIEVPFNIKTFFFALGSIKREQNQAHYSTPSRELGTPQLRCLLFHTLWKRYTCK